jgi:hypothetical protein
MSKEKYSSGWRPELSLKQVALDMVEVIFDESASIEECQMAANTLVEAVCPELFENRKFYRCPCGGKARYSGEALMGCVACDKCEDFLMGIGIDFLNSIGKRWMNGERGAEHY